jgi:hypothetical protein
MPAVLAILVGIVAAVVLLKLLVAAAALALGLTLAVAVYFGAEKLVGKGR